MTDNIALLYDNPSALNMAKNFIQLKKTKYIDARHYFLIDNLGKRVIFMIYCMTKDQVVDIFTKALYKDQFKKSRLNLELIKMN